MNMEARNAYIEILNCADVTNVNTTKVDFTAAKASEYD